MSPSSTGASESALVQPVLGELVALAQRIQAWPPARVARSLAAPVATSTLRGRGMEYAESRPYLPGDDARHIDWRVTARTGIAHSKLFHPERERTTLLVCDASPGLFFGTRVRFKSVQLARAAALSAWAARRAGERVGAIGAADTGQLVPPSGGRGGVLRVLHALCKWYAIPAEGSPSSSLARTLERARRLVHTGSRLVILADPASLAKVPEAVYGSLARHNDVLVVLLVDRFELAPPPRRLPLLLGGGRSVLDFGSDSVRGAWDASFSERVVALESLFSRWRIGSLVLATDDTDDRLIEQLLSTPPGVG